MEIPRYIKEASKVIGYFCHMESMNVFCDGDACVIAGSLKAMKSYLSHQTFEGEREVIKKTRFGEIIEGLRGGGAYAFDEESYSRFFVCATKNKINELPLKESFFFRCSSGYAFY